ncbi:MAG: F0F1 ATP synthase subunit A [Propionibacteriaceae bacterium]|jgi:F-type H+-transporting ATPase subunit a|nr:F0F1 ATP synthase subunit A [Propionibacteriaceae bacterium]
MGGFLIPLEGEWVSPGVHSFDSRPLFPGVLPDWVNGHLAQAVIGAALVIGFWLWVSRRQQIVPTKRQFVGEWLYDFVRNNISREALGPDYRKYHPYLLALFSFILVNNLFGEFFVFMFPTFSKIGYAYGLAVASWVLYNAAGIKRDGFGHYMKKMTLPEGVPIYMAWLIIPLEFLSNFIVRPFTLALRLFANLFAGHLVILVFVLGGTYLLTLKDNLFYNFSGGVSILFSFAIFALEIFIGALQAYIFTVLTAQYVHSSISEEH